MAQPSRKRDKRYSLRVWVNGSESKLVSSWYEASLACRKWLAKHAVGPGAWYGGELQLERDQAHIGTVGYDGTVYGRRGTVFYKPGDDASQLPLPGWFSTGPIGEGPVRAVCPVCFAKVKNYTNHWVRHHRP